MWPTKERKKRGGVDANKEKFNAIIETKKALKAKRRRPQGGMSLECWRKRSGGPWM
jgi:hypothetical protein